MTDAIDFGRSFLTFRIDTTKKPPTTTTHKPPYSLNNARIQIECRCRIVERSTGVSQTFLLGASCKTERVGVPADVWTQPNADFAPIFGHDRFMHLKTFAHAGMQVDLYPPQPEKQSDRQSGANVEAFDHVRFDIVERSAEVLGAPQRIVQATLANEPLVARTEIETERYLAVVEYPVKTMNANERDMIFQLDTGPVILPDLTVDPGSLLQRLELAFVAWNDPTWAEFLVRVPTEVAPEVSVYHYSQPVRLATRNQVLRMK